MAATAQPLHHDSDPGFDSGGLAAEAYEGLAAFYDDLTRDYAYERWLGAIDAIATELGAPGRRLLDAACGTGRSFLPMLRRGWSVTACDISRSMVARARANAPQVASRIVVADVRDLPWRARFDLVTILDDSANYLTGDDDLLCAFRSMRRALAPGGLLVFDCNTLRTCRWLHEHDQVVDLGSAVLCWRASGDCELAPNGTFPLDLDVFAADGTGRWRRERSTHWQRHHPRAFVERCAAAAGLVVERVYGQNTGARLCDELDEELHPKALYVMRRPPTPARTGARR